MLMSIDSYGSAWLLLIDTAAKWMTVLAALHRGVDRAAVPDVLVDQLDVAALGQPATASRSPRNMLSKIRTR